MLTCLFSDVTERDMDLLFLEEFACSSDFLTLFLNKTNFGKATVVSVEQSKTDKDLGESDITVIVEKDGVRYGLLIEDKIDAVAQPQQAKRYFLRGDKGVKCGEYVAYAVFIVAPKEYLEINQEACNYPNKISYEECLDYFKEKTDPRSAFKCQQIEKAIGKQKDGWQVVVDDYATGFWNDYLAYQKQRYPKLELIDSGKGRPSLSTWFYFRVGHSKIHIVHKVCEKALGRGRVDVQFEGLGHRKAELEALCTRTFGNLYKNDLTIEVTGKTAVMHRLIEMEKLDFSRPFEEQKIIVEDALQEIDRLRLLLDDLPKEELYALFE